MIMESIESKKTQKATFDGIKPNVPGFFGIGIPIRTNPGTIGLNPSKVANMENAIVEGIKPNVPGFFRIGFRFEQIPGRSA